MKKRSLKYDEQLIKFRGRIFKHKNIMYHAQGCHLRFRELSSRINARARLPSATARAVGKVITFRRSCVQSRTLLATFN
jgi:hypothetical protein